MKPASSPNWLEYDKSGKVVGRRFYSTDPAPMIEPPVHFDCSKRCNQPGVPLFAQRELALPAKPPRPRRAQ